ncbi:MAG: MFS transporter [Bacteroidia bacterium]|nr:MAG: MFS transporter [Bacteroidia bacterium]
MKKKIIEVDEVVVKFAGDSGDGMQLTGTQFSNTSAFLGEDVSTFPDYPAEIRAPQGTVGGVSGFQLHFGKVIDNPGDYADVLVAMNPAALKANRHRVKPGGTIILDTDAFSDKNFEKAQCTREDVKHIKQNFNIIECPISSLTKEALINSGLKPKEMLRCKNMFALGIVYFIFNHPLKYTEDFFEQKFAKKPNVAEANKKALQAGFNYAIAIQSMPSYRVHPAEDLPKGTYRNMSGNQAAAWGLLAAAEKSGLNLFLGSYPITPASEILIEISRRKDLGAKSFQAEDEIGGIVCSIGASFAGNLAATSTSGPGLALKSEALGLAVMTELPLVIINVQRGGPSTGLPTKTEQADLYQALFGRNGESPIPVIAASTPSNCFRYAFEAAKIALEHMTPVLLLTDGFLANGTEPWHIPSMKDMPTITHRLKPAGQGEYLPYKRDEKTLAREWAAAGTPGYEHRIGGLEKDLLTGNVSYVPENHGDMVRIRKDKVEKIADDLPDLKIEGNPEADLLLVGWGSTYGHLTTVLRQMNKQGYKIACAHFNYIYPMPKNTEAVLARFKKILVCEINMGQFVNLLRMNFPQFKYYQYNKVQGLPFTVLELEEEIKKILEY